MPELSTHSTSPISLSENLNNDIGCRYTKNVDNLLTNDIQCR